MSKMINISEQARLQHLLQMYPELSSIQKDIETNIANDENDSFILFIGDDPKKREFAHIIARQNGWYSKKIMSEIDYGTKSGRCSRCYWIASYRHVNNYDPDLYCCDLDDGVCVNKCRIFYDDAYNVSNGLAWIGEVKFSKTPMKLGRKTRRKRNIKQNLIQKSQGIL